MAEHPDGWDNFADGTSCSVGHLGQLDIWGAMPFEET